MLQVKPEQSWNDLRGLLKRSYGQKTKHSKGLNLICTTWAALLKGQSPIANLTPMAMAIDNLFFESPFYLTRLMYFAPIFSIFLHRGHQLESCGCFFHCNCYPLCSSRSIFFVADGEIMHNTIGCEQTNEY